ncbi:MAG: glycoside hydrolase family 2 TIM barrel-domain containing protein [Armatimonadota bacterium]
MQRELFDLNWRFKLGAGSWRDEFSGQALYTKAVDDSGWRRVDLPHDWSMELPRRADAPSGPRGGFAQDGLGWYRKHFTMPELQGGRLYIEFEGVYRDAEIWLNGREVGVHPYGYTTFLLDLTPYLEPGDNVLAVRVDNTGHEHTRWYSGSGIYRHVWLLTAGPVHVAHWGLSVTTPEVTDDGATVAVQTTVVNHTEADCTLTVRWSIFAPDGREIANAASGQAVPVGASADARQTLTVPQPLRWSPETPRLYRLETAVYDGDACLDREATTFGIRTIAYTAEQGFLLNGQPLNMRGGCVHHDCGPLGAASIDRAEERKIERLKASGYNAVRCAHNPPSPAFLDACDRLGMLVMDEAFDVWRAEKIPYDYHRHFGTWWRDDLDSMLLRDRHHPSVVVWSIGNELVERGLPEGAQNARMLADRVRAVDPTRPVTAGICTVWGEGTNWHDTDGLFAALDLRGYNYRDDVYREDHERFPDSVIIAAETSPTRQYDYWKAVEELPYVVGDFVWTAIDYLGEAGVGREYYEGENASFLPDWPWTVANCGDLDLCGEKRPQSYYRDILWHRCETPYIGVHAPIPEGKKVLISGWGWSDVQASWSWPGCEGQMLPVEVYFDCDEVELLLNGESLGVVPVPAEAKYIASFTVPYQPGELKAVARKGGAAVAESTLRTAGPPSQLRLTPDRAAIRADRNDLAYITVHACDEQGLPVPSATVFHATITGPGRIAALANANPQNTDLYSGSTHPLWRGRGLVIVQPVGEEGTIELTVAADGFPPAQVVIQCNKGTLSKRERKS